MAHNLWINLKSTGGLDRTRLLPLTEQDGKIEGDIGEFVHEGKNSSVDLILKNQVNIRDHHPSSEKVSILPDENPLDAWELQKLLSKQSFDRMEDRIREDLG